MGMSASSRLYYQWCYEKHSVCPDRNVFLLLTFFSRWISSDLDIFEIRDFEDPLKGPYLECIRDKITNDIRFALYDLWMAKDYGPRNNSQTAHDTSTTSSFLGTKYRCTSV
ncbi:hypothetical protein XELAEV_18029367mg [Xenopus laevis]|uniref:Uncharacterized protein n=1 Tax=Xenopus laevis TaxID=8355 RepID=A0A974HHP7_XENLA|nr:hypothetical protein XELAEV_18029367mg [Xenopus laevis]